MSNIVSLSAEREPRHRVRVSVFPLTADDADVEIETPDGTTTLTAPRYDATALMQKLEQRTGNRAGILADFAAMFGEGA